jgi:hypothetical protein
MFVIKEHLKITPGIVHDFIDWRSEELSGQRLPGEWMIQHIDFPPITSVLTAWQNKKPRKSLLELAAINAIIVTWMLISNDGWCYFWCGRNGERRCTSTRRLIIHERI